MWKSKSIFFSTASSELLFSRSFEPLFVCGLDLGMVENVCYILCTARFGSSNVLNDHGFDSGFMIAMYSFAPMGFQTWIHFIREHVSDRLVPLSLTTTQSSIRGPLPCAAGTSNLSLNFENQPRQFPFRYVGLESGNFHSGQSVVFSLSDFR